ncbi:hypothetical protein [Rhizobium phage RHEph12]|nr:hypothetical protein [Rhizobium phage RHEph12]
MEMTYAEYQAYMAKYGFISCPLTEAQFDEARATLENDEALFGVLFGVGCDVNAGVDFHVALKLALQNEGR